MGFDQCYVMWLEAKPQAKETDPGQEKSRNVQATFSGTKRCVSLRRARGVGLNSTA